jgi:hypothetical protein
MADQPRGGFVAPSTLKAASLALSLALVLTGCPSPDNTPPNQGSDRRAQDIRFNLAAFERTGEYGYLCHAAFLGSKEAAERLERDSMRCSRR